MKFRFPVILSLFCALAGFSAPPTLFAEDAVVVRLNPGETSPFNGGIFEGWGTSLCWWGNRIGYDEKLTADAAEAFFSTDDGLMLNIVRYNIGGGDDPSHDHIARSDSNMPGFAQPEKDASGAFLRDENGLIRYRFDWSKDANQVSVLRAILKQNPDAYVEAFSNSPPYFMTLSGCSSGGTKDQPSNLDPAYVDAFADFLAATVEHFRNEWGIRFRSIDPFNEPDAYWPAMSPKQEGCHLSVETINATLPALDRALKRRGVRDIVLSAADDCSYQAFLRTYEGLSEEAWKALDRINVHTYGGYDAKARADVRRKAMERKGRLWMSEVDGAASLGGEESGDMGPCLWLARRIIDDVNGLRPEAWVIWLVIDRHRSNFNEKEKAQTELHRGYWGTAFADHIEKKLVLGKRYYAFGQFTRHIRPGDRIIGSGDFSLSAINPEQNRIVVVAANSEAKPKRVVFDFSAFRNPGSEAEAVRTSGPWNGGENWAELEPIALSGKRLETELAPFSITTFVVRGDGTPLEWD